jgi:hypothetical protein
VFYTRLAIYRCWQLQAYCANSQTPSARCTDGYSIRLERTRNIAQTRLNSHWYLLQSLFISKPYDPFEMSSQVTSCEDSVSPIFGGEIELQGKTYPILRPQPLPHTFKWDDEYMVAELRLFCLNDVGHGESR